MLFDAVTKQSFFMECKPFLIDFNAFQQFDIENIYLIFFRPLILIVDFISVSD